MERIRKADGDALRAKREEHWFTQLELAHKSGVSRATIVEIEAGRNKDPRNETLLALAKALEINPKELLEGPDGSDPLAVSLEKVGEFLTLGDSEKPALGSG